MRFLLAIFLLTGCYSKRPVTPPTPTAPETELHLAWEREVDDAVAGFTAVRPRLSGPDDALELYDAQLKGLEALAGPPSVPAVQAKTELIGSGNDKAIKDLLAAKTALDAKTTALEAKAVQADRERLAAETAAKQAKQDAIQAEAASNLSRVAVLAIGAGILAFLFGSYLAIPKWVAASTVGLGVLVATTAPQLLAFFGSDHAHYLMLSTFGVLALGGVTAFTLWLWRTITPKPSCDNAAQDKPQEGANPREEAGPREG